MLRILSVHHCINIIIEAIPGVWLLLLLVSSNSGLVIRFKLRSKSKLCPRVSGLSTCELWLLVPAKQTITTAIKKSVDSR